MQAYNVESTIEQYIVEATCEWFSSTITVLHDYGFFNFHSNSPTNISVFAFVYNHLEWD
jgi:hypothetical protein